MKRFLSLFLVALLLISVLSNLCVSAAKKPTFAVSSVNGEVGDTVKVEISVKNNPGIIAMQVMVKYDVKALQLKKTTEGKFSDLSYSPLTANPFVATWVDPLNPNNDTNGTFVTLEFEILDTAPNGKSEITLSYDPENVFELNTSAPDNFKNVHFEVENGFVDIKNPNPPKQEDTSSQESVSSQQNSSEIVSSETGNNSNIQTEEDTHTVSKTESANQTSGKVDTIGATESVDTPTLNDDDNSTISNDIVESTDSTNDTDSKNSQNRWIIWVVIASIVVLGGAFAVVIIKSKKQ